MRITKASTWTELNDLGLGGRTWSLRSLILLPGLPSIKKKEQRFSLDYTQTLLSLLNIPSAFYANLAKLLRHSPHPGVSWKYGGRCHLLCAPKNRINKGPGDDCMLGIKKCSGQEKPRLRNRLPNGAVAVAPQRSDIPDRQCKANPEPFLPK
jgi:hypothetical protein